MEIIVGSIESKIANPRADLKALSLIREVCRARPAGFQYMARYRSGVWDGYITLMTSLSSFPSGLLPMVVDMLKRSSVDVDITYTCSYLPCVPVTKDFLRFIDLREYQIDAANVLLKSHRGVAKMATNSGKTEVMAAIIKALGIPNTIILLHRKELLYQTAERFRTRLGIEVGMIGDGVWDPKTVTIAMIQTLSPHISELDVSDNVLLMVDECHHASNDTMMDVMRKIPGVYRFGFSGTPLKNDVLSDMKLIGYTGPVLFEITNKYMIDNEYSAKPTIYVCIMENYSKDYWTMRHADAYKSLIVDNDARNRKIRKFAKTSKGTVLILVDQIAHGEILRKMISNSVFVHGSDTTEYRRGVIDSMKNGGVFIATSIFDEGIDVPSIDCLILAGGGKGYSKILQRIGRGLRHKEDGNNLVVYDFIDDTNKYLLQHSSRRIRVYASEGFETKLV